MAKETAVIDGCNILHLENPASGKRSIEKIFDVIAAVEDSGRYPLVVIDPMMFSVVGEIENLKKLERAPGVISVESGSCAARTVLETAKEYDAIIVSNNTYADYWAEYPWVERCRLPVAVIDGKVCLLERRFQNWTLESLSDLVST
jgi:hypothetical protein